MAKVHDEGTAEGEKDRDRAESFVRQVVEFTQWPEVPEGEEGESPMPFDPSVKGFAGATQEERREGSDGDNREGSDGDNREGSNGDSRERLPTGVPAPWRSPIGPSLLRKALNLTGAVAHHVATGMGRVSEEVHGHRLAICRACVGPTGGNGGTGYWNAERGRCEHPSCGCNMQIKTYMKDQICPIGKWGNEEEVSGNS